MFCTLEVDGVVGLWRKSSITFVSTRSAPVKRPSQTTRFRGFAMARDPVLFNFKIGRTAGGGRAERCVLREKPALLREKLAFKSSWR